MPLPILDCTLGMCKKLTLGNQGPPQLAQPATPTPTCHSSCPWSCTTATQFYSWASKTQSLACQCLHLNMWTTHSLYLCRNCPQPTRKALEEKEQRGAWINIQKGVWNLHSMSGTQKPREENSQKGLKCGQRLLSVTYFLFFIRGHPCPWGREESNGMCL